MAVYHLSETVLQFSKDGFMLHAKQISTVPRENDRILHNTKLPRRWRFFLGCEINLETHPNGPSEKMDPQDLNLCSVFFGCFRRLWRLFQYLDAAGGGIQELQRWVPLEKYEKLWMGRRIKRVPMLWL